MARQQEGMVVGGSKTHPETETGNITLPLPFTLALYHWGSTMRGESRHQTDHEARKRTTTVEQERIGGGEIGRPAPEKPE